MVLEQRKRWMERLSRKDKHGGEKTDMVDMAQDMVQKLKKENKQAGGGSRLMRTWETLSGCKVGIHLHPQAAANFGGPSQDGTNSSSSSSSPRVSSKESNH